MEICIIALLKDGDRVVGAFGYDASAAVQIFARKQSFSPRRNWQALQDHEQQLGLHRRRARTRVSRRRGR
jgi:hypothetical protein